MDGLIRIILFSAAIVIALALSISGSKKISKILLASSATIAAVGGFLIYGYTYSILYESAILASIKTIIAVIRSFAGANSFDDVIKVPLFSGLFFQIVFWIIQLLSIFSTANAALTTLGSNLLQNIRLRIFRKNDLYIIFGLCRNTMDFATDLLSKKQVTVVFGDASPEPSLVANAKRAAMAVKTDDDAQNGTVNFLKSVGMTDNKRKLFVFALSSDSIANQEFARKLMHSLQTLNVPHKNTSLTIFGDEDETDNNLFFSSMAYGYGNVFPVNESYLTSRLLLLTAPTYKTIRFDEKAKAIEDFYGILIGCDRVGQAVLRQIVMNSQFEGSNFHLAVFAPGVDEVIGRMSFENAQMLSQYDIQFFSHDGRSKKLYEYVDMYSDKLKYIVLCTGNRNKNMEIAQQLQPFLQRRGCRLPIYQCDHDGVRYTCGAEKLIEKSIYTSEALCSNELDAVAIALNHIYCGSGTPEENWAKCDYFSRMSSRASADFLDAMLFASGEKQGDWKPEGEVLENLAKTEHKRWCAFHYAMGFSAMSKETWYERAEIFKQEAKETGMGKIRIGKDLHRRIHACLVDWEALDELSERENAVTGKNVDYKQMDRNNIIAVSDFYRNLS